MRTGYLAFSLLLLSLLDLGAGQFVTLTAGTAAAAAATAGLIGLGAAGLGALGLAAAARGRGRRGRRFRGRGRRFRGRRDVVEEEDDSEVWDAVSAEDQSGCVQKLICLLEAADGEVDDDEKLILSLMSDLSTVSELRSVSKLPYETAGWLGKYRGASACHLVFNDACQADRSAMMSFIRGVWQQTEQEAPVQQA